jgi:hypothetical protein
MPEAKLPQTEQEWKLKLDPEQFRILRSAHSQHTEIKVTKLIIDEKQKKQNKK